MRIEVTQKDIDGSLEDGLLYSAVERAFKPTDIGYDMSFLRIEFWFNEIRLKNDDGYSFSTYKIPRSIYKYIEYWVHIHQFKNYGWLDAPIQKLKSLHYKRLLKPFSFELEQV